MTNQAPTDDTRILATKELVPPHQLLAEYPITSKATTTVLHARAAIQKILRHEDDRLLVIVGPCSIHDIKAALDYATLLQGAISNHSQELCIIMRVYFEKPRTTVGWKGLINDPGIDDTYRINDGLGLARHLLLQLADQGIAAGTEYLDLISPQYIADIVSWGAIGARTTESQCHRELASGLSCPVGFKNGTGGSIQLAIDAVGSASHPHHFLSVTKAGHSAIFQTAGNPDCHLILRGGNKHPNYDPESIRETAEKLHKAGLQQSIVVDCSHANSGKDHERQAFVCRDIASQVAGGETSIIGVMLESHLVAGTQKVVPGKALTYGQSITDACMNWDTTASLLHDLAQAVVKRRAKA